MSKSRGNIVRAETILEGFGGLKPDAESRTGPLRSRRSALLPAARNRLRPGRQFLLRRPRPALQRRPRQRLRQPRQPHALDDRPLFRRRRALSGLIGIQSSGPLLRRRNSSRITSFAASFDALDFSRALETAWSLVAAVDGYLTANAPWKQVEGISDEQQQALRADILYTAAEAIRIITALVYPVIPDAAANVWAQLGLGDIRTADLKSLQWRGLSPARNSASSRPSSRALTRRPSPA